MTVEAAARDAVFSRRWLVGPRYDLFFFIGSCVATWFFLGLYHGLEAAGVGIRGDSVLLTYLVFTAIFDHPHIFQTFSRTHADPDAAGQRRRRSWGLAAFVAAGFGIMAAGWERELIVFAAFWGTWHIIRQHWGFLRVYKALNRDFSPLDDRLDAWLFYGGMIAFVVYGYSGEPSETVIYGALSANFPSLPDWLGDVAYWVLVGLFGAYGARQLWLLATGRPVNLPKLLLLAAALSTHGLVFVTATPFLVAEALETAYHDIQYQGWIMHYQRRRFAGRRVVGRWLLAALAYGTVVGTIEVLSLLDRGLSWLFVPFAMVVLWHYYVDGKVWKLGQDRGLRDTMMARA